MGRDRNADLADEPDSRDRPVPTPGSDTAPGVVVATVRGVIDQADQIDALTGTALDNAAEHLDALIAQFDPTLRDDVDGCGFLPCLSPSTARGRSLLIDFD